MSPGHHKEIVGFVCRWCLLGGMVLAVVAVLWASVLAAAGMSGDLRTSLLMPDQVTAPASEGAELCRAAGYVDPPPRGRSGLALLAGPAGGLSLGRSDEDRWEAPMAAPWAGHAAVVTRGVPYGPAAFQTCRSVVVGVPRRRRVFLVDARLTLTAGLRGETVRQCTRRMLALGEVVLFHPGPIEGLAPCRRQLRQAGVGLPILCELKAGHPGRIFEVIARDLGRPRGEGIEVVTTEAALAAAAARRRLAAHLIGGLGAGARPLAGLTRHDSLANFKEYLSGRPIAE